MSKRYGRKQRRQARSTEAFLLGEMERLLQENDHAAHQLYDERLGVDQIRAQLGELWLRIFDWDNEVREMLGKYSAFLFESGVWKGKAPSRLEVRPPLSASVFTQSVMEQSVAYFVEQMHWFRVQISEMDPIHMRRLLRVKLTDTDIEASCGISGVMLHKGMLGDREIHQIALDVARLLVDTINAPPKKSRQRA